MNMIRIAFLAIGIFFFAPTVAASSFCDGFAEGYKAGYKQTKETNLEPLVPFCPIKPLKKFGDPDSDFEFGYTIGYKQGFVEGSE